MNMQKLKVCLFFSHSKIENIIREKQYHSQYDHKEPITMYITCERPLPPPTKKQKQKQHMIFKKLDEWERITMYMNGKSEYYKEVNFSQLN